MGKKRKLVTIEEVLARPWCYYCERDFEDLRILIQHQKARHFKCEKCYRRLNTAGGLVVHMQQVHKEQLTVIENALPNRSSTEIEIFGVEGIPEEVVATHKQRVIQDYYTDQQTRREATGNPAPGTVIGNAPKKSRTEPKEDMLKRLTEHVKNRIADNEAMAVNGPRVVTPTASAVQQAAAPFGQSPASFPFQQQPYPQTSFSPPQQFPPFSIPGQPFVPPTQSPFPGQVPQFQQYPPAAGTFPPHAVGPVASNGLPQRPSFGGDTSKDVDDLISSVQMEMHANKAKPNPGPEDRATKGTESKATTSKSKKKDRGTKFLYMSEFSPEESLAGLSIYSVGG